MNGALLALLVAAGPRLHLGPPAPAHVRRLVTLAPSLSEIVLALGAGDRLAGVTRFDDDPRTAKVPRIGGYNDPQPEAVLAVKPDLILAEPAPANRGAVETLARLGIPVDAFPLATVAETLWRYQSGSRPYLGNLTVDAQYLCRNKPSAY